MREIGVDENLLRLGGNEGEAEKGGTVPQRSFIHRLRQPLSLEELKPGSSWHSTERRVDTFPPSSPSFPPSHLTVTSHHFNLSS